MVMIYSQYSNKRLLFEFIFTSGRVLSIQTDPLVKMYTKNKNGKLQKVKVKSDKLKITNPKILILALMAINAKSLASGQASLTFTECQGV